MKKIYFTLATYRCYFIPTMTLSFPLATMKTNTLKISLLILLIFKSYFTFFTIYSTLKCKKK